MNNVLEMVSGRYAILITYLFTYLLTYLLTYLKAKKAILAQNSLPESSAKLCLGDGTWVQIS